MPNKKVDFHFAKPEESPGFLLWQVNMLWQRKINRELEKLQITHTQFVILAALAWLTTSQEEDITQVAIATHAKIDRMMVSKVLRTLETKELVARKENENDTRAKTVSLTATGIALVQSALILVESIDVAFFEPEVLAHNSLCKHLLDLLGKHPE